jgi:hypothetical protein
VHQIPHLIQLCASAQADPLNAVPAVAVMAVRSLPEVIDAATGWIIGILAAVATLFFVIGGLRYMTANGDPAAVEQAKGSFKSAGVGYALAVLAPVVLDILQNILGVRG